MSDTEPLPTTGLGWEQLGCRINHHSPHTLLDWYERAGFLYPAKRQRLDPVIDRAIEAWEQTLLLGDQVRRTCTYEDPTGRWSSMDQWLSASGTWTVQHLVSSGGGTGSRATLLTGLRAGLEDSGAAAWNSWFRMNNPMPRRVLATSVRAVGPQHSSLCIRELLRVPTTVVSGCGDAVVAVRELDATEVSSSGVLDLVAADRGTVFLTAEDLDSADPLLAGLDARYRRVGLTRRRHILLAETRGRVPVGVALVHTGPLATNFSFLEHRCDVVLAAGLDPATRAATATELATAAAAYYQRPDSPSFIPVVTDADTATALCGIGARPIQSYAHVIWLRDGLAALDQHFESCFASLARLEYRR